MKLLLVKQLLFLVFALIALTILHPGESYHVYAPILMYNPNGRGVGVAITSDVITYAEQFRAAAPKWIRVAIGWYDVESVQGVYDWSSFDPYYQALLEIGAEPIVILVVAPAWARADLRQCGRILSQYISNFAQFAAQAQERYPRIQYWEVWNEPDSAVGEGGWGCWGNENEPYYGGAYYAQVINPVRDAIRAVNPKAKVYFGGLMMPDVAHPQAQYFQGAVLAGAEFDGISLHYYAWCSTGFTSPAPQVTLLRQYSDKPILLTEVSMLYDGTGQTCEATQGEYVYYIQRQSDALSLQGWLWYALPDTYWHHSSLYDGSRCKVSCQNFMSYDD